jgi:uncharacterized protein
MIRVLALALLILIPRAFAQDLIPVPELTGRVVDLTGTLTPSDIRGLDATLEAFEQQKGSQVAVLMVPTTHPEEIEQYSIRVAEKWKLGRKKVDDGAILLVAKDDRTMRIEVGYGLEGVLTDAMSKRIISDIITPYFKQGDFAGGIRAGVEAMIKLIDGESLPPPVRHPEQTGRQKGGGFGVGLLVLAFFVSGATRAMFGRVRGGFLTGGAVGLLGSFILGSVVLGIGAGLLALLFTLLGGGGGGYRGGRRGYGGFGGFGGGGFGGGGFGSGGGFSGGGGSFGGGGASGRW